MHGPVQFMKYTNEKNKELKTEVYNLLCRSCCSPHISQEVYMLNEPKQRTTQAAAGIILRLRGKLCSLIRVVGRRTRLKCKQIGHEKEARKATVDS